MRFNIERPTSNVKLRKCEKCESIGSDGKMPADAKFRQEKKLGDLYRKILTCEMRKGVSHSHFSQDDADPLPRETRNPKLEIRKQIRMKEMEKSKVEREAPIQEGTELMNMLGAMVRKTE
jgi:hypothetical protein